MRADGRIWIVDDDQSMRWVLHKAFTHEGWSPQCFSSAEELLTELDDDRPDVIISDIRMQQMGGLSLLERLKTRAPEIPTIIITAYSNIDHAVSALREGAYEYLSKPFDVDEITELVRRVLNEGAPEQATNDDTPPADTVSEIIGQAPAMQEVFRAIARLSNSNLSVLITGETGTGKELVARALHRHSPRADKPFIAINTAATPRELLESEFFGHEKGAFTGAIARRTGRFEQADGGTLFLDEIGDMPFDLQTRLLRVLVDGEFHRVGGLSPLRVNVRIITATHQDIERRVTTGNFREDLLHRLNVVRVHIPPLRERPEDISMLLTHFLFLAALELRTETKILIPETEQFLACAEWPGNVRQLENFCHWITIMAPGREIHLDDLPPELRALPASGSESNWQKGLGGWIDKKIASGGTDLLTEVMPTVEQIMIEAALRHTQGKRQEAAKLLGWGRNTLTRKINELQIKS